MLVCVHVYVIFAFALPIVAFRFSAPQNKINPVVSKRFVSFMLNPLHDGEETVDIKKLAGGMKYRTLPNSDLKISEIGLGTMNFGDQVRRTMAFDMLDCATKNYAVNFIDTSEGFPMPLKETTYGHSESIIGDWLQQNPKSFREKIVLSTKVVGSCEHITWMRKNSLDGTRITKKQVEEAVDNSLRRLKTDYIDVLSFQWPDRYVVGFGSDQYFDEFEIADPTPIREQLEFIAKLMKKGKIRHFALSNETPFGIGMFTATAQSTKLPSPVFTTQAYNLLNRYDFETSLKEALRNAKLPCVAYAPLAGGALTGKYLQDWSDVEDTSRMKLYPGFQARYISDACRTAVKEYMRIAEDNNVALAPLALAWVLQQQSCVSSTLVGATTVSQLDENIRSKNFSPLNKEINEKIDRIFRSNLFAGRGTEAFQDPRIEKYDPRQRPWGLREEDVDPEITELLNDLLLQQDE